MESGHGGRRHVPVEEEGSDSEGEKEEGEVGEQVIIIKMKILLLKKKMMMEILLIVKKMKMEILLLVKKMKMNIFFVKRFWRLKNKR